MKGFLQTANNRQNAQMKLSLTSEILKKSELQNFKTSDRIDGAVLVLKNEGRLMLTDTNGVFHKFIVETLEKVEGNLLIVLLIDQDTRLSQIQIPEESLSSKEKLFDKQFLETLYKKGMQPSVELLMNSLRILMIKDSPNEAQTEFFCNFLFKSLYKTQRLDELGGLMKKEGLKANQPSSYSLATFLSHFFAEGQVVGPALISKMDVECKALGFSKEKGKGLCTIF